MRVLVVEDDKELNNFIRAALKREGFVVDQANDGKTALERAEGVEYDVVLLDVVMPELDGLSVLKQLRKKGHPAAILMVTSQSHERDKLAGLNSGADDYIVKPFLVSELVARIRAVLRRHSDQPSTLLTAGNLRLDLIKHTVELKGKPIELTKKEFELLEYFMRRPGQVLTPPAIMQSVWNMEYEHDTNIVEAQVKNLRAKIADTKQPFIETLRGVGYRFEA